MVTQMDLLESTKRRFRIRDRSLLWRASRIGWHIATWLLVYVPATLGLGFAFALLVYGIAHLFHLWG